MTSRALSAELLKYRRTPALALALGVPAFMGVLVMLVFVLGSPGKLPGAAKWGVLETQLFGLWTVLVLPLGTSILSALAAGLEHGENHLKQILVLPPSRGAVYLAKLAASLALVLAGTLALSLVAFALVGIILGFPLPVPWAAAFRAPLIALAADLPVLALGVWLGMRLRSFAVPMGVGVAGAIAGSLAVRSSTYWPYLPWAYPFRASQPDGADLGLALGLSLALGLALALVGAWDFARRDIL